MRQKGTCPDVELYPETGWIVLYDLLKRLMAVHIRSAQKSNKQPKQRRDLDRKDCRPTDHHVEKKKDRQCKGKALLRGGLSCGVKLTNSQKTMRPKTVLALIT